MTPQCRLLGQVVKDSASRKGPGFDSRFLRGDFSRSTHACVRARARARVCVYVCVCVCPSVRARACVLPCQAPGVIGVSAGTGWSGFSIQLEQEDRYTTYTEKRPSSKPSPRKKWKQQHPNYNQSDKLNRTEQVILFRLRTGHNRLNTNMYNKFKVGESEMCPCNAHIMTAENLLQHCPLHDAMRRDTWPNRLF